MYKTYRSKSYWIDWLLSIYLLTVLPLPPAIRQNRHIEFPDQAHSLNELNFLVHQPEVNVWVVWPKSFVCQTPCKLNPNWYYNILGLSCSKTIMNNTWLDSLSRESKTGSLLSNPCYSFLLSLTTKLSHTSNSSWIPTFWTIKSWNILTTSWFSYKLDERPHGFKIGMLFSYISLHNNLVVSFTRLLILY